MLAADKTIKIINAWHNNRTDEHGEVTTRLDGCSAYFAHRAKAVAQGKNPADYCKIRIPYRSGYMPSTYWEKHHPKNAWTLRIGDRVTVDGQMMTIMLIRDNTLRYPDPHWYVEAE